MWLFTVVFIFVIIAIAAGGGGGGSSSTTVETLAKTHELILDVDSFWVNEATAATTVKMMSA